MISFVRLLFVIIAATVISPGSARAADGAPGGASFLDMILLGLVIYLVFRMFRRRSGRWTNPHDDNRDIRGDDRNASGNMPPQDRHEQAKAMWDMLSDGSETAGAASRSAASSGAFDESEFLEGAKLFYTRFQEAKDSGNWDMVSPFVAPDLLSELRRNSPEAGTARTQIMLLDAKVMEVRPDNGGTEVTVFFNATLRKGVSGEREVSERNAWEFSREDDNPDALWVLERINKIDH